MDKQLLLPKNQWLPLESGPPHECPYLPDRQIQLDLGVALPDPRYFDILLERGCRRLGQIFYTPACEGCRACIPIRVATKNFRRSKSQRRLWNKLAPRYDVRILPAQFNREHYEVYERHSTHVSDDNTPSDPESYVRAFLASNVRTHLLEYRVDGHFVGASILDEGDRTLSSVYVFWDPRYARFSPGTFSALWELDWATRKKKAYYYLGYWLRDCDRMSYKNRFRPYQLYHWQGARWLENHRLEPENWPEDP